MGPDGSTGIDNPDRIGIDTHPRQPGAPLETRDAVPVSAADVDATLDRPVLAGGTKRLFVKEIQEALLDHRVDVAVHSSKDMPAEPLERLTVAAALPREDPRDAVVLPAGVAAIRDIEALRAHLGDAPRLGTASVRRVAQLAGVFEGAVFAELRGNLDTRLRKLDAGACDAIVLAAAGLRRLGHGDRITWAAPFELCLPAPGQGIVAVEVREDDTRTRAAVATVDDAAAADALAAERAVVRALGGGCQMPIGAIAVCEHHDLHVRGAVIDPQTRRVVRNEVRGPRGEAGRLGEALARALLAAGAGEILDAVRRQQG